MTSGNPGERALHLLNTTFGHPAFRGAQQEIVSHVTSGGDGTRVSMHILPKQKADKPAKSKTGAKPSAPVSPVATPTAASRAAPPLGADSRDILREAGLTRSEIESLVATRVVGVAQ